MRCGRGDFPRRFSADSRLRDPGWGTRRRAASGGGFGENEQDLHRLSTGGLSPRKRPDDRGRRRRAPPIRDAKPRGASSASRRSSPERAVRPRCAAPANTFMSRRPPRPRSTGSASSVAATSSTARASSVARMPVSFGARSERMTSAGAPRRSRTLRSVSGSRTSPVTSTRFGAGSGSMAARSTPTRRPRCRSARAPPGASHGPGAEVDDPITPPEETIATVQLGQLVGASRAEALGAGAACRRPSADTSCRAETGGVASPR